MLRGLSGHIPPKKVLPKISFFFSPDFNNLGFSILASVIILCGLFRSGIGGGGYSCVRAQAPEIYTTCFSHLTQFAHALPVVLFKDRSD